MKKKDEQSFKLSYESDGKMGKKGKNLSKKEKEKVDFFNITPDSE